MRLCTKTLPCLLLVFAFVACTSPTDEESTGDVQGTTPDTQEPSGDTGEPEGDGGGIVEAQAPLAISQLGVLREARGVHAPAGLTAIVQGAMEKPMYTSEVSTDEDGNRVVTYDFSNSSFLDSDGSLPSGTRTEIHDPNGRFLSWSWSEGGEYSCHYGETITCMLTAKEGGTCTDTFDYEGSFVKTTCEGEPASVFTCTEEVEGTVLCDSELQQLSCYDRFGADLSLIEAGCTGFMGSSVSCSVGNELVNCDIMWLGTSCVVEFDDLFNVESRNCVEPETCGWGGNSCPVEDLCTCAWRESARNALCDENAMDNVEVSEPDTTGLLQILLGDATPIDGPLEEIFVDTNNARFFLRITNSGFAGPDTVGPYWYGPFSLEDPGC